MTMDAEVGVTGPQVKRHPEPQKLSSVQSLGHVTPWTAAHQASLSITNSWSLLTLMPIESMTPSNYLIFCRSPSPPAFNLSQRQGLFQ